MSLYMGQVCIQIAFTISCRSGMCGTLQKRCEYRRSLDFVSYVNAMRILPEVLFKCSSPCSLDGPQNSFRWVNIWPVYLHVVAPRWQSISGRFLTSGAAPHVCPSVSSITTLFFCQIAHDPPSPTVFPVTPQCSSYQPCEFFNSPLK